MVNHRRDALVAVRAAIGAVNPAALITRTVKLHGTNLVAGHVRLDLSRYRRILVVGGGKAGVGMASGIERILDGWITDGVINVPENSVDQYSSRRLTLTPASHPSPSLKGMVGVKKMLSLVGKPDSDDLVICLISGGASAMMPLPARDLTLSDKLKTTELMIAAGASIGEVNTVRRHLSQVKGGRLAQLFYPATILSLIISDVVGDRLEDIGSGPTAPDPTTYADAKRTLKRHGLWEKIPRAARKTIQNGVSGSITDTHKPGSRIFKRVFNIIVGNNETACLAAAESLQKNGYRTLILTRRLEGEARQAGRFLSGIVSGFDRGSFTLSRPLALVAGGETTVMVRGRGRGGRNQELALSAALGIEGMRNVAVASAGTDGIDGRTDAAGAFADGTTVERALARGMVPEKYLDNNDSYNFFKKLSDLIVTGLTGTNVGDITIALAGDSVSRRLSRRLGHDRP